jgi:hypothetical protein
MNRETACSLILYDIHIFQLALQIKQPNSLNLLPPLRRQRPSGTRIQNTTQFQQDGLTLVPKPSTERTGRQVFSSRATNDGL